MDNEQSHFNEEVRYGRIGGMSPGLKAVIFLSIALGTILLVSFLVFPWWLVPILIICAMLLPLIGFKPEVGFLLLIALFPLSIVGTAFRSDMMVGLSASGIKILGFIVVISFLISRMVARGKFRYRKVNIYALLFLLTNGLSLTVAENPERAFISMFVYTQFIIMFFLATNLVTTEVMLRRILWVTVIATAISALLGILQSKGFSIVMSGRWLPTWGESVRVVGGEMDPNYFSITLNLALFMGIGIFLGEKSPIRRIMLTAMLSLILFTLMFTLSRGGVVIFLGTLSYLLIRLRKGFKVIIFVLILGVIIALFLPEVYWERLSVSSAAEDPAVLLRIYAWKAAIIMWFEHPILGVGLANFKVHIPRYLPIGYMKQMATHNTYLEVLAETGLPGFLFFAAMMLSTFRGTRSFPRIMLRERGIDLRNLSLGVELGFIAVFLGSIFVSAQQHKQLWIIIALGMVMAEMGRHLPERQPPTAEA